MVKAARSRAGWFSRHRAEIQRCGHLPWARIKTPEASANINVDKCEPVKTVLGWVWIHSWQRPQWKITLADDVNPQNLLLAFSTLPGRASHISWENSCQPFQVVGCLIHDDESYILCLFIFSSHWENQTVWLLPCQVNIHWQSLSDLLVPDSSASPGWWNQ